MRGVDRVDLLNRLSTNDLTQLTAGKGLQTVLTTDKARIIDVLMILNDTDRSIIVASPDMGTTITKWLRTYTITDDVRTTDATAETSMLEITGARAADVVRMVTGVDVALFTIGEWTKIIIDDQDLYIFRMPPSVELSYWIAGNHAAVGVLKDALKDIAGLEKPLTESDVEYVRVMQGIGASRHEWTDAYNPLEANLLHLTSFTKGCYIGQEIIARLDSYNKVKQRILGFASDSALHVGDTVVVEDAVVGAITTVTKGRETSKWYALGYIRGEQAHAGATVRIGRSATSSSASEPSTSAQAEIRLLPMVEA